MEMCFGNELPLPHRKVYTETVSLFYRTIHPQRHSSDSAPISHSQRIYRNIGISHNGYVQAIKNEPPHGKTNNLQRRKQRRRSASQ